MEDINDDGALDLVIAQEDGKILVYPYTAATSGPNVGKKISDWQVEATGSSNPFNHINFGYSTSESGTSLGFTTGRPSIAFSDLDGDGHRDLLIVGGFISDGNTNPTPTHVGTGDRGRTITVYFNNKAATGGTTSGWPTACLADGSCAANPFTSIPSMLNVRSASGTRLSHTRASIAMADLNGDGYDDLIIGPGSGAKPRLWLNSGSNTFPRESTLTGAGPGCEPFNWANECDPFATISVGTWDGGGEGGGGAATGYPYDLAFGDMNGDGFLDMALGYHEAHGPRTWFNTGNGAFEIEANGPNDPFAGVKQKNDRSDRACAAPYLVDIDSDGDVDLLMGWAVPPLDTKTFIAVDLYKNNVRRHPVTTLDFPTMAVRAANKFNGLTASWNTVGFPPSPMEHLAPAFFDCDGDGDMDMLVGGHDGSLRLYWNYAPNAAEGIEVSESAYTTLTSADNGFCMSSSTLGGKFPAPTFGDVNFDGNLDLVIGCNDMTIEVYLNNGGAVPTWTASPAVKLTTELNPFGASSIDQNTHAMINYRKRATPAFGDIDGDGDLDLVIGYTYDAKTLDPMTSGAFDVFINPKVFGGSAPTWEASNEWIFCGANHGTNPDFVQNSGTNCGNCQCNPFRHIVTQPFPAPTFASVGEIASSIDVLGKVAQDHSNVANALLYGDSGGLVRAWTTDGVTGDAHIYLNTACGGAAMFSHRNSVDCDVIFPAAFFPQGYTPHPQIVDVDGDGRTDLVLGCSGGGWGATTIAPTEKAGQKECRIQVLYEGRCELSPSISEFICTNTNAGRCANPLGSMNGEMKCACAMGYEGAQCERCSNGYGTKWGFEYNTTLSQCLPCPSGTRSTTCAAATDGCTPSTTHMPCQPCNHGDYAAPLSKSCSTCFAEQGQVVNAAGSGCELCATGQGYVDATKACEICAWDEVAIAGRYGVVQRDGASIATFKCHQCDDVDVNAKGYFNTVAPSTEQYSTVPEVPRSAQDGCDVCPAGKYKYLNNCSALTGSTKAFQDLCAHSQVPPKHFIPPKWSCSFCPNTMVPDNSERASPNDPTLKYRSGRLKCREVRVGVSYLCVLFCCCDHLLSSLTPPSHPIPYSANQCDVGQIPDSAQSLCVPCDAGKYKKLMTLGSGDGGVKSYGVGSDAQDIAENAEASTPNGLGIPNYVKLLERGLYHFDVYVCAPCPNATISTRGMDACSYCAKGTYPVADSSCVDCSADTFAIPGMQKCAKCPTGEVPLPGNDGCKQCEAGTYPVGGSECLACTADHYSIPGMIACLPCPADGVTCRSGVLELKEGWWYDETLLDLKQGWDGVAPIECLNPDSCTVVIDENTTTASLGLSCPENAGGALCAICFDGFVPNSDEEDGACKECASSDADQWILKMVGFSLCGFLFFLVALFTATRPKPTLAIDKFLGFVRVRIFARRLRRRIFTKLMDDDGLPATHEDRVRLREGLFDEIAASRCSARAALSAGAALQVAVESGVHHVVIDGAALATDEALGALEEYIGNPDIEGDMLEMNGDQTSSIAKSVVGIGGADEQAIAVGAEAQAAAVDAAKTAVDAAKSSAATLRGVSQTILSVIRTILAQFPAGQLKILIANLQINASFPAILNVPWPSGYSRFLAYLSLFKLDIFKPISFSIPCMHSTHYMSLATFGVVPIAFVAACGAALAIAFAIWIAGRSCQRCCKPSTFRKLPCALYTPQSACTGMMKILVVSVLFVYPALCSNFFTTFRCITVGHHAFLAADMKETCYEGDHLFWMAWSVAGMALYVIGIPVGLTGILYIAQRRNMLYWSSSLLTPVDETPAEVTHAVGRLHGYFRNQAALGSLYEQYEPSYWWFELACTFRKMILTGALVLLGAGTAGQVMVALFVCILWFGLITNLKPFGDDLDDRLAQVEGLQILFTLLIGLVLQLQAAGAGKGELYPGAGDSLGIILIFLNFLVIGCAAIQQPTVQKIYFAITAKLAECRVKCAAKRAAVQVAPEVSKEAAAGVVELVDVQDSHAMGHGTRRT